MTEIGKQGGAVSIIEPTALEAIVRAEVDIQVATAKRYPRDVVKSQRRMTDMATMTQDTALSCMYAVPRAGKSIEGASVRLAEIVYQCWGNLRVQTRNVGIADRHIVTQGVCHDLETNNAVSIEKQRRITKKDGSRFNDDGITTTANANASIAFRDAILRCVPKAIWEPVYLEARKVAIGDIETLSNRRAKMVEVFQKMGALPDNIFAAVGKTCIEEITLDDLGTLGKVAMEIRNGETTVDAAFPTPKAPGPKPQTLDDVVEQDAKKPTPVAAAESEPDPCAKLRADITLIWASLKNDGAALEVARRAMGLKIPANDKTLKAHLNGCDSVETLNDWLIAVRDAANTKGA